MRDDVIKIISKITKYGSQPLIHLTGIVQNIITLWHSLLFYLLCREVLESLKATSSRVKHYIFSVTYWLPLSPSHQLAIIALPTLSVRAQKCAVCPCWCELSVPWWSVGSLQMEVHRVMRSCSIRLLEVSKLTQMACHHLLLHHHLKHTTNQQNKASQQLSRTCTAVQPARRPSHKRTNAQTPQSEKEKQCPQRWSIK